MKRQSIAANEAVKRGLCSTCFQPRHLDDGGTSRRCGKCADKQREYWRTRGNALKKPRKDPRTHPAKWERRLPQVGEMIWDDEKKVVIFCANENDVCWVLVPR